MSSAQREEVRELFEAHRALLFRYFYHLTSNTDDADDLLQETFLTFWRKRDQFAGNGSLVAYLRKTGYRLHLNRCERRERRSQLFRMDERRRREEQFVDAADRDVERSDGLRFLETRVRRVLDELPRETRDAFILFRFEGLSTREIGELSGTSPKTIETRVRRATRALHEGLAPHEEDLPLSGS